MCVVYATSEFNSFHAHQLVRLFCSSYLRKRKEKLVKIVSLVRHLERKRRRNFVLTDLVSLHNLQLFFSLVFLHNFFRTYCRVWIVIIFNKFFDSFHSTVYISVNCWWSNYELWSSTYENETLCRLYQQSVILVLKYEITSRNLKNTLILIMNFIPTVCVDILVHVDIPPIWSASWISWTQ